MSCYEEFVLKTNLLGKKISDKDVLNCFNKIENYYWTICDGYFLFLDNKGNKADNIKVRECFYCYGSKNLTSLKGAPQKVSGSFYCSKCENLTSLEGASQEVSGNFNCSKCENLTSLEGASQKVGGDVDCSNTQIPEEEIEKYREFLKYPTPKHIDETGHYKP